MHRQLVAACVAACALAVFVPAAATAQSVADFTGSYTLNRAASEDVHAAIDEAVRSMNFVTRRVARGRLRRHNAPFERLVIAAPADSISVTFDDGAPAVSPAEGVVIRWTDEDGEQYDLSTRITDGGLEQRLVADDGIRSNVYTLGPDGRTLTMHVTITSPRLPQPLTYRLVYDRS